MIFSLIYGKKSGLFGLAKLTYNINHSIHYIWYTIFIGSTDDEAEAPILWPPDAKSEFIGKDPDAGKDWRQKEKGAAEGKMVK